MYALSARELHDAERTLSRSRGGAHKTEARALGAAVDLLEVGGGLFAWGLVNGRYGVIAPMGVSLDGLIGLAFGALAIFDVGGDKISPHVMNLGLASMGSFLMRKGVQVGTGMRTTAGLPALGASDLATGIFGGEFARGAISSGGARDLSDAELAAMTEAARARR